MAASAGQEEWRCITLFSPFVRLQLFCTRRRCCERTHIVRRYTEKPSSQMQGTVQISKQTTTDNSSRFQKCLIRPAEGHAATLTLNCCFSQAEAVEAPIPPCASMFYAVPVPIPASRFLARFMLSCSLCLARIAASAVLFRSEILRSPC